MKVLATIQDAGSIPAVSKCGDALVSIGLIEGTGGIRKATTVTAQTIKAKDKVLAMRSRPVINTDELAYAA